MELVVFKVQRKIIKISSLLLLLLLGGSSCEFPLVDETLVPDKVIALTFDDGPDPIYTPQILDILKEKDVKATFFLMGKKIEKYPKIAERIYNEGHFIANHTYSHINLPGKKNDEVLASIAKTELLLEGICGQSYKIFRPPWGHITDEQKVMLKKNGYRIVMWDVNSHDYKSDISVNQIIYNVMENIDNKKVILLHDSDYQGRASRKKTVQALPQIIDLLKEKRFAFVTATYLE